MACTPCYTADLSDFRELFPEFTPITGVTTHVSDSKVQSQLDKSGCVLSDDAWGCTKAEAQLYHAAHFISIQQNALSRVKISPEGFRITTSGAGAVISAAAGGISAGFAASATQLQGNDFNLDFATTSYGRTFLALKYVRMPIMLSAACQ